MNRTILFVTPPYHCGVVEVAGRWAPLALVYLAGAARRAGWNPVLYDAMTKFHDHGDIRARIAEVQPDVVAVTAITATWPDALEVLRGAKEVAPGAVTVAGGVHPSFMYREILEQAPDVVDFVVRGEGEETLAELLAALEGRRAPGDVAGLAFLEHGALKVTRPRALMQDLEMPDMPWELLDWEDYTYFPIPKSRLGVVSTSRGCSHGCTFCSQQKFWQRSWRARAADKVVDEILHLRREYGANVILIADEYPTQDRDRWRAILDGLIEAGFDGHLLMETRAGDIVRDRDFLHRYREAGIIHVYVGLEATEQATLDTINKELTVDESMESIRLLREHGMVSETSFILGFPDETPEKIERTLDLARQYDPDMAHFLTLAPWPYAELYEEMAEHVAVTDYRRYNLVDPVIKPRTMSLEQIDRALVECYRRFYMGRLKQLATDADPFRKRYMLTSVKLMMRSSFLKTKLGSLGRIPAEVEKLLAHLRLDESGGKDEQAA